MGVSASLGRLWVELGVDDKMSAGLDRVRKKTESVEGAVGKTGSRIGKIGAIAGASLIAGIGALGAIGVAHLKESETVMAQTAAVIESTGGAAKVTAGHIGNLAGEISAYSGLSDEAIQSGENMLLTFTNVQNRVGKGNDVFDQATGVLADMSVALGTDMKGQAIQLGKALNDPIKGVSALARVGVTFTDEQKDQIKAMVEAGDTAGAQKLILAELRKEFGGSAKAAGQTFTGQLNILKETLGNVAGEALQGLMPVLTDALPVAAKALGDVFKVVGPLIQDVISALKPVFESLMPIITQVAGLFAEALAGALKIVAPVIQALAPLFAQVMEAIAPLIPLVVELLTEALAPLIPAFVEIVKALLPLLPPLVELLKLILPPLAKLLGAVAGIIARVVVGALRILVPPIKAVIEWVSRFIGNLSGARDKVANILGKIKATWERVWGGVADFFGGVWQGIKAAFAGVMNLIIRGINLALGGINLLIKGANKLPFVDIPLIPKLAEIPSFGDGGIVPGPPGTPRLAIVHSAEEVLREDDPRHSRNAGGGDGHGHDIYMDGEKVARLTSRRQGRAFDLEERVG